MSVISGNFNPHLFLWDTNLNYTLITSLSTHIEFNDVRSLFQLILSYTTCKLSLLWFSKYNEPEGRGHFVCMYIYLGEQWPFFIHELIVFCILLSSILLNIRTNVLSQVTCSSSRVLSTLLVLKLECTLAACVARTSAAKVLCIHWGLSGHCFPWRHISTACAKCCEMVANEKAFLRFLKWNSARQGSNTMYADNRCKVPLIVETATSGLHLPNRDIKAKIIATVYTLQWTAQMKMESFITGGTALSLAISWVINVYAIGSRGIERWHLGFFP